MNVKNHRKPDNVSDHDQNPVKKRASVLDDEDEEYGGGQHQGYDQARDKDHDSVQCNEANEHDRDKDHDDGGDDGQDHDSAQIRQHEVESLPSPAKVNDIAEVVDRGEETVALPIRVDGDDAERAGAHHLEFMVAKNEHFSLLSWEHKPKGPASKTLEFAPDNAKDAVRGKGFKPDGQRATRPNKIRATAVVLVGFDL